jgi:hypothetical protein
MHVTTFTATLTSHLPPENFSLPVQALWYDAKGDWQKAHSLIDHLDDPISCHVHAYLHRKEGDAGNARYWYHRAGKPPFSDSLQKEWELLVMLYA